MYPLYRLSCLFLFLYPLNLSRFSLTANLCSNVKPQLLGQDRGPPSPGYTIYNKEPNTAPRPKACVRAVSDDEKHAVLEPPEPNFKLQAEEPPELGKRRCFKELSSSTGWL